MKEFEKKMVVARLVGHKYVYKVTAKCEWLNYFWLGFISSEKALYIGSRIDPPGIAPITRRVYKASYEKDGKKKVEITHQPREWRLVQVEVYASPEKGVYA